MKLGSTKPHIKDLIEIMEDNDKQEGIEGVCNRMFSPSYTMRLLMSIQTLDLIQKNFKKVDLLPWSLLHMRSYFVPRIIQGGRSDIFTDCRASTWSSEKNDRSQPQDEEIVDWTSGWYRYRKPGKRTSTTKH